MTLIQNLLHGYQLTLKVVSREQLHFFYAPPHEENGAVSLLVNLEESDFKLGYLQLMPILHDACPSRPSSSISNSQPLYLKNTKLASTSRWFFVTVT
ncbi:hypothetical protein STHE1630_01389 [Streptococcus thermophilus CNCM I-1630]|nr:hypothetical protein STHE1630_01389 [Streptococcus thermophilus CNCM I-1630]